MELREDFKILNWTMSAKLRDGTFDVTIDGVTGNTAAKLHGKLHLDTVEVSMNDWTPHYPNITPHGSYESKLERLARLTREAAVELEAAKRKHAAAKQKLLDYIEEAL